MTAEKRFVGKNNNSSRETNSGWQIGLAFFVFILIGLNDGAFGVLLPSIRTQYALDKGTVGLVFFASTTGYLIAAFASGLLTEKFGPRNYLMISVGAYLLGAVVVSTIPIFPLLLLSFGVLGFGIAGLDAGLNSFIALLRGNSVLLNYLHAFYGVGALLGPVIASITLAVNFGWNTVYFIWIGFSLIIFAGFRFIFQKKGLELPAGTDESKSSSGNVLALALKLRVVWLGALFLLFYVGAEVSLGSWSYTFLTEDRGEAALYSGWSVSGYWLGLTLGRVFLGKFAERAGNKYLIEGCLAGVVVGILIFWLLPFGAAAAVGLVITGFCLGPIFPTTIALMSGLVPARILPSSIGFMASLGAVGASFFPWVAGNLAQWLGLWTLLPYALGLTILMLFIWLALNFHSTRTIVE